MPVLSTLRYKKEACRRRLKHCLCKEGLGLIFFPEDMGDSDADLVRAFEQVEPVMALSVWLVCHQELRTNLRVRRVFDFIAERLEQSLKGG